MHKLKDYILPLLWIGVISMFSMEMFSGRVTYGLLHHLLGFFGISMPYHELKDANYLVRKAAHLAIYAVLAVLWFRAFRRSGKSIPAAMLFAFMISFSCGALDELHQSYETGRTALISDVFIDVSGAAAALLLSAFQIKKRRTCAAPDTG